MLHIFKLRTNAKTGKPASKEQFPVKSHATFFKNVSKYIADHAKDDAYNIFIPQAQYSETNRQADNFLYQEILAFDLDHVDVARVSEYPKIICSALGVDKEKCVAICSGSGIHFVLHPDKLRIGSTKDFQLLFPYYKAWCLLISDELKKAGLAGEVDDQFFQPSRSIRVPHTLNCKPAGSTPETCSKKTNVFFIQDEENIYDTLASQMFLFTEITPVKDDKEKEYLKKGSYGRPDVPYILDQCSFLKEVSSNVANVSEPQWFEAINIVSHFQDEFKTAHAISKGYPTYSAAETQERAERAHYSYGPSLCASIEQKVWDKCKECPHYGKVRSPIQLKSKEHISTEENGFTVLVKGKPVRQYEDLRRHFSKKYEYIVFDDNGEVRTYDGKKYNSFLKQSIKQFAQERFIPICEKESERVEFYNQVISTNVVPRASFDPPKNKINLLNGIYDIKTKELIPHSAAYYFTSVLPFEFNAEATCPTWDQFLKNISLGRQSIIDAIEEYIGYCLLGGDYTINKMLILAGDGSNGKTTLLNLIKKILGADNCSFVPASKYGNNHYLANLYGKLANISEETGVMGLKDTEIIKLLTGDGTLEVDCKFERPFNFQNRAKIIMTYNKVPYLGESTVGIKRRLMIIPFDLNLEEELDKKIVDIQEKLESELSGILNRCMIALNRLLDAGSFTEVEETKEKLHEMLADSDPIYALWTENLDFTGKPEDCLQYKDVWDFYEREIDPIDVGSERRISQRKFFTRLRILATKEKKVTISMKQIGTRMEKVLLGVKFINPMEAEY